MTTMTTQKQMETRKPQTMPSFSDLSKEVVALLDNYKNLGLTFPPGYNVQNELSRALLKLTGQKTKQGPVLKVCTKESIVNALLDMCIQGLTVTQGYFIPYENILTFQRSYFGTVALIKRLTGARDIVAQCVYKGDEFEYEIENGIPKITKHKTGLQNMGRENVVAAYATITFNDGRRYTEIMPLAQILAAWRMSRAFPFGKDGKLRRDSTHYLYFEEMAKRTAIQRACKVMLNSSVTDPTGSLIVQRMNEEIDEASEMALDSETTEAIENMEVLELPEETPTEPVENPSVIAEENDEPEELATERPF